MSESYFITENLSVGYDKNPLIHDICLDIKKGEIVALIGPNGSGKSTILKSITKHLKLIGGTVSIGNRNLDSVSYQELSKELAVVLTERIHPELMTCYDIVAMGRYPFTGRFGVLGEEDRRIIEGSLDAVGIRDIASKDFLEISDGQRQRVLLARAFCQEPKLIVLDEPTSFLDIRHKLELLKTLKHLAKEKNITVLLSLHEIDLAQKFADKIVCVKGDTIFGYGTSEDMFTPERIRTLYDIKEGDYDVILGSVELPRVCGTPKVVVLSNAGNGIKVYRRLQKQGIPFVAGILSENDLDYQIAKKLAMEVVEEKAFEPISDRAYTKMIQWIDRCEQVLLSEMIMGTTNCRMKDVIKYAEKCEKLTKIDK